MNDDHILVRPIFRVLYGIVSVLFVLGIFLGLVAIVRMLDDKVIRIWELLTWSMFVKWYRASGHLEKSDIETKLLEVRYDNKEKELFEAI